MHIIILKYNIFLNTIHYTQNDQKETFRTDFVFSYAVLVAVRIFEIWNKGPAIGFAIYIGFRVMSFQ